MDAVDTIDQPTSDIDLDPIDQPTDDTPDDAEPAAEAKPEPTDKVDGRKFPSEWSKAMKELRELYPDKADMLTKLRDNWGRYGAVSELAPKGVEEIRGWKSTVDALGGPEAAAELMQRAANMDEVDSKIEAGDYSVVGELPESLQKGFYQMIPDALADLSEKDPQAFEKAVAPHFAAALAGTGMEDHLKEMYKAAGDNEPLKALISKQWEWYQRAIQGTGKMTTGAKSADPQVARLQAELDTRRQADDQAFTAGIVDTTNKHVATVFDREAAVYLKQLNLSDAQKSDLADSFNVKLVDKLANDAAFQKQLGAYKSLKSRNPETVNSYIRGKIEESAKSIMDGLVTARYGGMKKKAPPPEPGTKTTDNGATRVAAAPDQSQWDMAKMTLAGYDATVKKGIFYLQGGRTVQLAR